MDAIPLQACSLPGVKSGGRIPAQPVRPSEAERNKSAREFFIRDSFTLIQSWFKEFVLFYKRSFSQQNSKNFGGPVNQALAIQKT